MIGKPVIVRANVAGVHSGILVEFSPEKNTVLLKNAYRLWRVYTRDKTGSISDIAANGLKPDGNHSIGAKLEHVLIHNPPGFEIAEMTLDAYKSVCEWEELKIDGYGSGSGKGKGYGWGWGDGWGDGEGWGDGWGDGEGWGRGWGDGWGDGEGRGRGWGDGEGWGDGNGFGVMYG